jgi:hypothetical protein
MTMATPPPPAPAGSAPPARNSKYLVFALCLATAVIAGLLAGILATLAGMNAPNATLTGGGAAGGTLALALTAVVVLRDWK